MGQRVSMFTVVQIDTGERTKGLLLHFRVPRSQRELRIFQQIENMLIILNATNFCLSSRVFYPIHLLWMQIQKKDISGAYAYSLSSRNTIYSNVKSPHIEHNF